jgi:hypothetical protein
MTCPAALLARSDQSDLEVEFHSATKMYFIKINLPNLLEEIKPI